MKIKLVRPTLEMKEEALAYRQSHFDAGEHEISGSELLDQTEDYAQWVQSITANTSPETVNPAWVVTDTYFAVDENDKIVGIIDLRHSLNDFLQDFGNVGYSVKPSERRKGYATEMFCQVREIARQAGMKELHMAVHRDNEPSVKTIVNAGGVAYRSFIAEEKWADMYLVRL
ncbi:MAG: GNAT family N-acetyltransferase [Lachnospiraceae bacterium]|nr:GNAT family N-acetyltransferase [Lachnospiraceae bacterium]